MPTSHTLVTIANRALDVIAENPISTLQDNNVYARWINRNYSFTVEAALRQQPWNFAVELHELNPDPVNPSFRWLRRFALPPGWLRVIAPTYDGSRYGRPLDYEVKRNFVYMNETTPRRVELVMNIQDPGEWDPLFAELIAARLATGMAYRFTAKKSYVDVAKQTAQEALDTAVEINAFEGSAEPIEQYDIIRIRGEDKSW